MTACTARATGKHKTDKAFYDCPRCGPMLRSMDRTHPYKTRLSTPPEPAGWPEQRNRQRRGHDFYPPGSVKVPALGSTEDVPVDEKVVVAHYFVGSSDWWIVEADAATGEAFGYARLNGDDETSEWGYIMLPELEQVRIGAINIVERDLDWEPAKVGEANLPAKASLR